MSRLGSPSRNIQSLSFLLSIKDAHDLAVAINDLQAADDYGSVHNGVSLKHKRSSCTLRVTLSARPRF
jgi:hypothetical protein